MLSLVGGGEAHGCVRSFSLALDDLYSEKTFRDSGKVADELFMKAQKAVDRMSRFVIRNCIDALPKESGAFGKQEEWKIDVPRVNEREIELLLRIGRAIQIAEHDGNGNASVISDPRFDVGWKQFDHRAEELPAVVPRLADHSKAIVEKQLEAIWGLRDLTQTLVAPQLSQPNSGRTSASMVWEKLSTIWNGRNPNIRTRKMEANHLVLGKFRRTSATASPPSLALCDRDLRCTIFFEIPRSCAARIG
jgi:hypothetical protein